MKLRIFICTFIILLFLPQCLFAFTGLVLPFYSDPPGDMAYFEKLLKNREFEKASLELAIHIVLNNDSDSGRAFTLLGMALYGQGNGEQAAQVFDLASKSDKLLSDVLALYKIKSFQLAQKPDSVISAIDEFNTQFSSSFYANNLSQIRAESLENLKQHSKAANAFLLIAGPNPESLSYSKYRIKAANCFLMTGDTAKAKTAIVEILFETKPGRYTSQALDLYFKLFKNAGPKLTMTGYQWYKDNEYQFAAPVLKSALNQMSSTLNDAEQIYELRTKYAYALYRIHHNDQSLKQYNILIDQTGCKPC